MSNPEDQIVKCFKLAGSTILNNAHILVIAL